jgi:predicted aminopeptidase
MVLIRLFAVLLVLPLTACQLPYLLKSSYHQARILKQREDLEKVLANDAVPEEVKRKLRLAKDAKDFAENHLGLTSTKNYSTYVDLKRPYVSWIVQAAKEYELTPYLWHFPFVGSLPYKGFFSEREAREEASRLDPKEYDTYIRGVTAYSTLGWFHDPILNTMIAYPDADLVELIIHESVHATLYIKSQAEFNERLATYIGQLGAEKYFTAKEGKDSPTVKRIRLAREDQKLFSAFLSRQLKALEKWYQDHRDKVTPESKAERLKRIQRDFDSELKPRLRTEDFNRALSGELNNAVLVGYKTYNMDLTDFERLYDKLDGDIGTLITYCKNLEKEKDPAKALKDFLKPAG